MHHLLLIALMSLVPTMAHFGGRGGGFFGGFGRGGGARGPFFGGGPPFLQNVTRQGIRDFFQIFQNQTLTKAEIQMAIGNWAATNNVTDQVTADNTQRQQLQQQERQNLTTDLQQLPSTLNQTYQIIDNQNLTPAQERQQIGQIFSNLSFPLNALLGTALRFGGV